MSSYPFKLNSSIIIKAGAGAGKTTALTSWYLKFSEDFYKKNNRYPNIIISTFTKKATQEIKERLVLKANELGNVELIEHILSSKKTSN